MAKYNGPRKKREYKKESEERKMIIRKCPYCGNSMKYKGPKGCAGVMYWKCRNKQCGRTVSVRKEVKPAVPVTYDNLV